jgi:hypothetical protein
MPNFRPTPAPFDVKQLSEYVMRELRRVGDALSDNADQIHYRTITAEDASLSAGISANWKCENANVIRMSTSNTVTVTGIAFKQPMREFVFINVGTGVVAFKNAGTESSASYRFALPSSLYQLSANHAVIFWYDHVSSRHRPIART